MVKGDKMIEVVPMVIGMVIAGLAAISKLLSMFSKENIKKAKKISKLL
jgi:hypothetical protein